MTTKMEAVQVARKFKEDFPDIAGRTVRVGYTPPNRYNGWFEWKWVSVSNPRKTRRLAGGPVGSTHFVYANAGGVHMIKVGGQSLPTWDSHVVYPFHEDLDYCMNCRSEFTLEEKIATAEWALENDNTMEPYRAYELEVIALPEWRSELEYRESIKNLQ